jgi:hypothetical protein
MFVGIGLLPATWSIIASMSRSFSRLRVRAVTCGCPIHGGSNSGRKVMSSNTGRFAIRFTPRLNSSRLVGSAQCTSSGHRGTYRVVDHRKRKSCCFGLPCERNEHWWGSARPRRARLASRIALTAPSVKLCRYHHASVIRSEVLTNSGFACFRFFRFGLSSK